MKRVIFTFALIVGLIVSASTAMAQTVNMSSYITLTVKNGVNIKLQLKAYTDSTLVKIKNGSNEQIVIVNKAQTIVNHTTTDTIMTIYGNVITFDCGYNGANITALDPSHNIGLLKLICSNDSIRNLDVTKNTSLELLDCNSNQLGSLDVTKNTKLRKLNCFLNNLSSLDITKNTRLVELNCHSNRFTSLDVTKNTLLININCHGNRLTSLDISHNTQLDTLYCYGNAFTTASLDTIYCSLPDKFAANIATIYPLLNYSDPNKAIVLATNKQNATAKNWNVKYFQNNANIATTGRYVCTNGSGNSVNMNSYIKLTVKSGEAIKFNFRALAPNTPVKITSGSHDTTFMVGTLWKDNISLYTAHGTDMTVYGDLAGFDCRENGANITALGPSNNQNLRVLYCMSNQLKSIDVSQSIWLELLDCSSNQLKTIDITNNERLIVLWCQNNKLRYIEINNNNWGLSQILCWGNSFTTDDINDIYCALPTALYGSSICPLYKFSSVAEQSIVEATNASNATSKNWKVEKYVNAVNDIKINTTGSYVCGTPHNTVNMDSYVTLDVKRGSAISLVLKADSANTLVNIASGSRDTTFKVSNDSSGTFIRYRADSTEIKIYGDITKLYCDQNGANITALDPSNNVGITELYCNRDSIRTLDVSQNTLLKVLDCSNSRLSSLDVSNNTQLTKLSCFSNQLTTLDVTKNTKLAELRCSSNRFTSLDVTKNTELKKLSCSFNRLTSFDVTKNTLLTELDCFGNHLSTIDLGQNTFLTTLWCSLNKLSTLDISACTQLTELDCSSNNLSNIDISKNTKLKTLTCHGNQFNTSALDDIYCALPDMKGKDNGVIRPIYDSSSSNHAAVLATNKANATAKNWKVQYGQSDTDIPATTGTYVCGTPHTDIAEASAEQALTLYPNPVADVLYLSATARTIRIYNVYGIEVAHATNTDRVEVSHLSAGVYTVKADGTAVKMVKR